MSVAVLFEVVARLLLNLVIWLRDRSKVLDGEARERSRRLQEQQERVEMARAARRNVRVGYPRLRDKNGVDKYRRD